MHEILRDVALCSLLPPEIWVIILKYRRNAYDQKRKELAKRYTRWQVANKGWGVMSSDRFILIEQRCINHNHNSLIICVDVNNDVHYGFFYWKYGHREYVSFYRYGENIVNPIFTFYDSNVFGFYYSMNK